VQTSQTPIPIIDLFAGPGGLGEGFASLKTPSGSDAFRLGISIEKEASAYRTLLLRAVQRRLHGTSQYSHYIDYVTGRVSGESFRSVPAVASAFDEAALEAKQHELGRTSEQTIDSEIRRALNAASNWVLIGGPPCQAYSLAGRSRRANDTSFSKDVKHFLYKEYLRIIRKFKPAVFVMENVKGLLSSTHSGTSTFGRILEDLSERFDGVEYDVLSLVADDQGLGLAPEDYLIQAERFGIPQTRHRVILLGVRKGFNASPIDLLKTAPQLSVAQAIHDLPPLRSRLSRGADSPELWSSAVREAVKSTKGHVSASLLKDMRDAATAALCHRSAGAAFISHSAARGPAFGPRMLPAPVRVGTTEFKDWVYRPEIGGVLQHETRAHIPADLARYLFAASFAQKHEFSPRLRDYPDVLLPEHENAKRQDGRPAPFQDRFRVQVDKHPSATVVSHIAKDGHYYIHYDPSQCRSLTVREAARLQTFPDDYFFEGNRTEQYTQVGNAVPPLLAHKIAAVVHSIVLADTRKPRMAYAA
jgi:DNA (cytosine-5)-methyltransferase 1